MEGFKIQERANSVETENGGITRTEKIKMAEQSIADTFGNKLAEVLERIGENPYFRDLEQTV